MLAMGTQFIRVPSGSTNASQIETAEFYSSACDQGLRLFSYLNRTSVRALQSMVLMNYYLLNSNHASDSWAFSGILIRQAYAMGLNRDPSLIGAKFTPFERLERRRLWHSVMCQDSFMSMLLKLPPSSTHSDIDAATPPVENKSIFTECSPESPGEDPFNGPRQHDQGYVESMVSLALLCQETIATPRSLSLPMAASSRQRNQLLARYRVTYRSFPDASRVWDEAGITDLARGGETRLVRQVMFLTGLYWHCVMLIQAEGVEDMMAGLGEDSKSWRQWGKDINVRGTLEAAHKAMRAFFAMDSVLKEEAQVWWLFSHGAFFEAVCPVLSPLQPLCIAK
jgi:transcription factor-like protein